MARLYASASSQAHTINKAYLPSAAEFTVSLWLKPTALSGVVKGVLGSGVDNNFWMVGYTGSSNEVQFYSEGHSGSSPFTGSTFALPSNVVTAGAWIGYRYKGASAEWSRWLNGTKTTINSSITFALGPLTALFEIGRIYGTAYVDATIAEVSLWTVALHDEQMRELAAGVAADRVGGTGALAGYWPLRGNSSPERSYVVLADSMTAVASPAAAPHPTIVPPIMADTSRTAWVVDLFHPSGTKRGASADLSEDVDIDVLGAAYRSRLIGDITITDSDPTEQTGGVQLPGQVVLEFRNADGWLDRSWEWRQCPVRIREYDRTSHALVTEFVGVIVDPTNMANDDMAFTCSGADEALLQQQIPRLLIEAPEGATGIIDDVGANDARADVGAPLPCVFGEGGVSTLPFLGTDPDTGAGDFIAGWGTANRIQRVWYDFDLASPGLDLATVFYTAPGTPVSATSTTFTVTGDQSKVYTVGLLVRRRVPGLSWSYSHVTAYSGGTVTVADAILPASPGAIGDVEVGGEFIVERNRWKYVGAATTFLTTIRMPALPTLTLLAELGYPALANPADVIKFVLESADQGLGQTCNAASFAQAAADFTAAGLGSAVRYVLGGDRSQRECLAFINEICALRGAYTWKDPETAQWMMQVDTAPTVFARTLEFGKDLKNDIAEVLSVNRTPLSQATKTLTLRYAPNGRARGTKSFVQQDYAYRARMTVLSGLAGLERTIESQVLRSYIDAAGAVNHDEPKRVLYYRGKKLQRSDQTIRFRMLRGGRRVRRGHVFPFTSPSAGVSGSYRIIARERRLNDFVFTAVGPYNADIYETNMATINAAVSGATAEATPDERTRSRGAGMNLLLNPDFSTGLKRDGIPTTLDQQILPGWEVRSQSAVSAFSLVRDPNAKGGAYLQVTTGTVGAFGPYIESAYDVATDTGIVVRPGAVQLASIYIDSNASGGPSAGWQFEIDWSDLTRQTIGTLYPVPGDVNGFGWQRYYGVIVAKGGASWGRLIVRLKNSNTTYKLDAVQFEELSSDTGRPTEWTRNPAYGLSPTHLRDGAVVVLATGQAEAGMQMQAKKGTNYDTGGITLSGASTVVGTAGPGLLKGMSGRVTTAISGPASWRLALDFGGGVLTPYLDDLPVSVNSTFGDDKVVSGPIPLTAAVNIVAIPTSGTFSAGKAKVLANVESNIPPTS